MIDTLDRRRARGDPACQDHLVVIQQIWRTYPLVEPQIHTRELDHPAVVAQRFIELLFAGDLFGNIKLPANFACGIEQRHAVPARRRIYRKRQPRGARPDNRQAF